MGTIQDNNATRRRFIATAGATAGTAVAAPIAAATASPVTIESSARLEARITELEDTNALRKLSAELAESS